MIPREPDPFKNLLLKILVLCAGLLLADALLVAATSLWVGLVHQDQRGFWVPIFAGSLLAVLAVWLFIRFLRAVLRAMRRSDILRP
jgi:membrane protein implicated in regulation of membrane protease activity